MYKIYNIDAFGFKNISK